MAREIDALRREVEGLRVGAAAAAAASGVAYGVPPTYQQPPPFAGGYMMPTYPAQPHPGSMHPGHPQPPPGDGMAGPPQFHHGRDGSP